jgi:hypothetical protein
MTREDRCSLKVDGNPSSSPFPTMRGLLKSRRASCCDCASHRERGFNGPQATRAPPALGRMGWGALLKALYLPSRVSIEGAVFFGKNSATPPGSIQKANLACLTSRIC